MIGCLRLRGFEYLLFTCIYVARRCLICARIYIFEQVRAGEDLQGGENCCLPSIATRFRVSLCVREKKKTAVNENCILYDAIARTSSTFCRCDYIAVLIGLSDSTAASRIDE